MFIIKDEKSTFPIKIWLRYKQDMEESCLEQAYHLSVLPFLHKWVCLMPDTHTGKGMPIGGVIAAKNVVIPNAVGSDIGCGMAFVQTNLYAKPFREIKTGSGSLLQMIIGDLLRSIPLGFQHHKTKQESLVLDQAFENKSCYESQPSLFSQLEDAYFQTGTLGGGNHFIELQEDENGLLCIMLHSGSRNLGYQVCSAFHQLAQEQNQKWYSIVPNEYKLAFLPVDTPEGKDYLTWMQLCLSFAYENRQHLLKKVQTVLDNACKKYLQCTPIYTEEINCHHNYAALEHHYGSNVWVHRKGAIRAMFGEKVIIPGAMGSYSYIAEGLGEPTSFCSASHGAGRLYSRKGAMDAFSCEQVILDLKKQGVVLGKNKKSDVAEESRFAYKDIDTVLANEKDLIRPIKKCKTIGVVKG